MDKPFIGCHTLKSAVFVQTKDIKKNQVNANK